MGESVTEGSIVEWRKKVGEYVAEGDPLVEVTTDKVDVEVPATASGVIKQILAGEGSTVAVGAVLAEIDPAAKPQDAKTEAQAPKPVSKAAQAVAAPPAAPKINGQPAATQQARRVARSLQIDITRVRGSGPDGLILREDVEEQAPHIGRAAAPAQPPLPPIPSSAKVTQLKGPVAALAGYMEASLQIPTATTFRTLPVDVLDARRKELNAAITAAGRKEKVSFTHLIAYALVRAAHELPFITAHFRRDGDKALRVEPGVHLGLAVDAERKDGTRFLIVPVVKNADALDFAQFHSAYEQLVRKARENSLTADDVQGASFTLTNPGGIGTTASVARLMPGQGAIIAVGAIGYPSGFAKASEATLRSMGVSKIMQMSSTYDHRVIQGAQSGEFLRRVDELLHGKDQFYENVFASLGLIARATVTAPAETIRETIESRGVSDDMLRAVAAGMALVAAYRTHGHLAAHLDPLGLSPPAGDPSLEPANWGLTPSLQAAVPASVLRVQLPGVSLADIIPLLRETYSSTIAYEIEHISNTQQREWLRDEIESGKHRVAFSNERKIDLLQRLTRVESFERYLRKFFLGQKTFSVEGIDAMIPMLEELLNLLGEDGVGTAVIGMAHRGRLNTIAHIVNRPYEEILSEFEAAHARGEVSDADVTGDVKYHHGATGTYRTSAATSIAVTLVNNPSHLEAVDPVVEGMARALQTNHSQPVPQLERKKAAPILIHGDAAFTGQGVVAEVLNLQALDGYSTGGTVHLIANNQIGFTTDPPDARSTRYASDLAKGFDVPIVHVNADDLTACIWAVNLAVAFRRQFGRDVLIDLIGYRRFGHNEQDEPAYTQPQMSEKIRSHPTVRELFANSLVAQNVITAEQAAEFVEQANEELQKAHHAVKDRKENIAGMLAKIAAPKTDAAEIATPDRAQLVAWTQDLGSIPKEFAISRKLQTQFERRNAAIAKDGNVDWGMAEALAFASLLTSGVAVRLSGQDTERGTFSHRHMVLHEAQSDREYIPLRELKGVRSSLEIYDSPLSEYACVGFEYGYSVSAPRALVLWEAQFGDFNNGAQIVIDQFIAAGQAKWGQSSRLVLLLPHGYEGMGPEHSSARLERFLQLTAEANLRVANPSTAGNYYHLLRQQAGLVQPVPLIVMTPKSLLRQDVSSGNLDDMAAGVFHPVIDDPNIRDRSKVERLLLCSGKVYYDLTGHKSYAEIKKTAIARIELLAPLPYAEINAVISGYPNLKKIVWVQEEPKNMGARAYVRRRLIERVSNKFEIEYIGRPYRASPSEGYPGAHAVEQDRLISEALTE